LLKLVSNVRQLAANVIAYQKAAKGASKKVNPSLVQAWYYIPSLDMVGASRFIGYDGMTPARYDQSSEIHVDGDRAAPQHLSKKGWFRDLQPGDEHYQHAHSLAAALQPEGVYRKPRFYILKDAFDRELAEIPGEADKPGVRL
jgi:hypothetical protein